MDTLPELDNFYCIGQETYLAFFTKQDKTKHFLRLNRILEVIETKIKKESEKRLVGRTKL